MRKQDTTGIDRICKCVCVCLGVSLCMHMYMHIYIYVYIYICMYVHVYVYFVDAFSRACKECFGFALKPLKLCVWQVLEGWHSCRALLQKRFQKAYVRLYGPYSNTA